MRYLLDVNALLALLVSEHSHYPRVIGWVQKLVRKSAAHLVTCPITEIGFIRIVSQETVYNYEVAKARQLLEKAKSGRLVRFSFAPDDLPTSELPSSLTRSNQITDSYLLRLALNHGAILATLDEKIPGAFLIPA
jgi:predicted nucleic acid-binding protein